MKPSLKCNWTFQLSPIIDIDLIIYMFFVPFAISIVDKFLMVTLFPGHQNKINPYIYHWEPVDFDRSELEVAHQKHIEQKRHRKKRDLSQNQFGPAHTIKLNFRAHDK